MALDLSPIRDENADVVKAGAFRLTLGTQLGAAIAALVTAINPIFGDTFRPGLKTAIIIASIAALAVIGAADVIARAWATCCSQPRMALAPKGVDVRYIPLSAEEEQGWTVVALRPKPDDRSSTEFLIVKHGHGPAWVDAKDLEFR